MSSSFIATPTLYEYTPEFQAAALLELSELQESCSRNVKTSNCSALGTLIDDYGAVRAEIRGILGE